MSNTQDDFHHGIQRTEQMQNSQAPCYHQDEESVHLSDHLAGATEGTGKIGVEDGVPVTLGEPSDAAVAGDASAVHEEGDSRTIDHVGRDLLGGSHIEFLAARSINEVAQGAKFFGDGLSEISLAAGDDSMFELRHERMCQKWPKREP